MPDPPKQNDTITSNKKKRFDNDTNLEEAARPWKIPKLVYNQETIKGESGANLIRSLLENTYMLNMDW